MRYLNFKLDPVSVWLIQKRKIWTKEQAGNQIASSWITSTMHRKFFKHFLRLFLISLRSHMAHSFLIVEDWPIDPFVTSLTNIQPLLI